MAKNIGYINTVQDLRDLVKNLEGIDSTSKVVFVDTDYNQYQINLNFSSTCIGDALGLDHDDMVENGENYFEPCLNFEVE